MSHSAVRIVLPVRYYTSCADKKQNEKKKVRSHYLISLQVGSLANSIIRQTHFINISPRHIFTANLFVQLREIRFWIVSLHQFLFCILTDLLLHSEALYCQSI
jgi:hypothetical protein